MATSRLLLFGILALSAVSALAGVRGSNPVYESGNPSTADFNTNVMPLLSKLGCNAVACHGSPKGKGGLVLSMFGANPLADYDALTRADGGRRVNRVEPAKSLFLLKATAEIDHLCEQKLGVGTPRYNLLLAWVSAGAPLTGPNAPALVSLTASPCDRLLQKGQTLQLAATAVFSDGAQKNVTDAAVFSSSDAKVASVDDGGLVTAGGYGEAAIIVSYLRRPAAVRVTVPQPLPVPFPQVAAGGWIDQLVVAKLKKLGIPPSDVCSDEEFLRRVYLDVTGTLPTADEARSYLADQDPQKRGKLIDRLLDSQEFADYWAMKWSDLLRIKSEFPVNLWPNAVQAYHGWVRASIAANKPYDQFARELLTATGSNFRDPPANFYRAFLKKDPLSVGEVAALTFMGARVGCARCHGHPTERWNLEDDLGLAAFFSQLKYKSTMEWKEEIVLLDAKQTLRHPRTGDVVRPKVPGGEAMEIQPGRDERAAFADWLTAPENPWFARNAVNRVWFWLLGRGIVHEPDDLRPTNPPENPQLLDYLAKELIDHKYDLKHVYRLVLNSHTYQRSARTNEWNRNDVAHFSHYYVKRLGAETLLDAIEQVTGKWDTYQSIIPEPFVVMPAGSRATHLADGSVGLPFLELFGRPPRDTAYESERDLQLYLRQTLHLLNSNDVQNKINNSPWLAALLKDVPEDSKVIDGLYLATVSRHPSPQEKSTTFAYVSSASRINSEAVTAQQAAEQALSARRKDLAKANTDFDAAARASKEAETTASADTPDARRDTAKLTADGRKVMAAAKAARDKVAASEKAAVAKLNDANKKLDAARADARQRRAQAIQDVLWALLNSKEFVFNH